MIRKKGSRKIIYLLLCITLLWSAGLPVNAADILFTRKAAESTAIINSDEYAKLESELALKEVELVQAVKEIKLKKKNMSTFRWSPLINFKFPEKANLEEEFEFTFKPIELEIQIDILEKKLADQKLASIQEVNETYTDIVVALKTIEFYEGRIRDLEDRTARARLDVKTGNRSQDDVDTLEEKLRTMTSALASKESQLAQAKKKLGDLCGMDLSTGFRFEQDFAEVEFARSQLAGFITSTVEKDIGYYETSMNTMLEKIAVETNYSLMEQQYQGKMGYISDFVKNTLAGRRVDNKAFKQKYDEFLKAIDEPWQGSRWILFLKIPKEWFKGEIDGIRYVEDASYSLYEASLSYRDALLEKKNQKKALETRVEEEYNNLISLQKSYQLLNTNIRKQKESLDKDGILLKMGELGQDEYLISLDEYEELQIEALEILGEYSNSIYAFDRLTCGAVTELINMAGRGRSTVEAVYAKGAYYYMESLIQEQQFRLGINIPVDFPIDITHFELWCNGIRIGERTEIGESLRHLRLAVEDVEKVGIRFYSDDEFIDECIINPEESSGPLNIIQEYTANKEEDTDIGSYRYTTNQVTGMVTLALETEPVENIGFYRILDKNGKAVGGEKLIPINKSFTYLGLLMGSLEELKIQFYDKEEALLYSGYFDAANTGLKKEVTVDE